MLRRIVSISAITLAFMSVSTLLLAPYFRAAVEASSTFYDTREYAGWMNLKKLDASFLAGNLWLKLEYYEEQPNMPDHRFKGEILLDIDRNFTTGRSWWGGRNRGIGADYDIVFAYSVAGSKYPTGAWLQFWNSSTNSYQGWESLDLAGFTDGVEINIPLNFIQNSEAVDIIVYSQCETFDRIDQAFSYSNNQNSIIVVDGAPSDWDSMTPAIVDPAGDVDPPDFDFTRFYTTNDQYRIFHRFDVSGILNLSIPGSVDNPRRAFYYIYYDIDNNASTGCPSTWRGGEGEGAEYRLWIGLYDSYYSMLDKWDGNNWIQAFDWAEAMKEIPVKFDAVVEVAVPLSAINATLGNTIRIFVGGIHGFSAIVDDFLPDEGVITLESARAMIPWPLGTVLWMLGAVLAVGGIGFATLAGGSARTLRRILMTAIIFGLSFTMYYPIAQLPANARDPLRDLFYLEFAIVLLVAFLFSALEKGLSWPFIFGNSLTWGLVFGYNFFFGYPYWLIILYLIVDGLFFGFLYVFLGTVGQNFIGWIRNRKISSQLRAHVPTNVPAPSRASRRSVLAKKIRCRKCGHAIPDTDEYCVYCGVRFKKRIF